MLALVGGATLISSTLSLGSVVEVAPTFTQSEAEIAESGGQFFVTWLDGREGWNHVRGARISSTGVRLDPRGFRVADTLSRLPSVARADGGFLVSYARDVSPRDEFEAVFVSPAGVVGPSVPLVKSLAPQQSALAFDGTSHFFVWSEQMGGLNTLRLSGGVVSPQLPDGGAGLRLKTGNVREVSAVATSSGAQVGFISPLPDGGDRFARALVTPGLVVSSPDGGEPVAEGELGSATVLGDGRGVLFVWNEDGAAPDGGVLMRARRSSADGVWLDTTPLALTAVRFPSVRLGGSSIDGGWLIAWDDGPAQQRLSSLVLDSSGAVTVVNPLIATGDYTESPVIAANDALAFMPFTVSPFSPRFLRYNVLNLDGSPRNPLLGAPLTTTANSQTAPSLARGADRWLATWTDGRDGGSVWGSFVFPNGDVQDPFVIAVDQLLTTSSVASDGTNFVVSWGASGRVYSRTVTPGGAVGAPVQLSSTLWGNRVLLFDGTGYTLYATLDGAAVHVVSANAAGVPFDGGLLAPALGTSAGEIHGAFLGPTALVVATTARSPDDLRAVLHTPSTGAVTVFNVPDSGATSREVAGPTVAALDAGWLVTWRLDTTLATDTVRAVLVFPDAGVTRLPLPMLDAGVQAVTALPGAPPRMVLALGNEPSQADLWLYDFSTGLLEPLARSMDGESITASAPLLGAVQALVRSDYSVAEEAWRGRVQFLGVKLVGDPCANDSECVTQRCSVLCLPFVLDAGSDAGVTDAGTSTDAGAPDDGGLDAGASLDAGMLDAGPNDAGTLDAGFDTDGGLETADAGLSPGRSQLAIGCACSSLDATPLLALALWALNKRRRLPSRRPRDEE